MTDYGALIEAVTTRAAIQSGVSAEVLQARGRQAGLLVRLGANGGHTNAARWTKRERRFLRDNIGRMTDEEIGEHLGRTAVAVKIKRVRWRMPAHSKRPGWLTGNDAAKALGIDIHAVMRLCERGLLQHEVVPGERGILNIREIDLKLWAINPENWMYFKVEKVGDERLKRLVELRMERSGVEWWSTGQVAEWHGVEHTDVQRLIERGEIQAKKWGNWWVRKDEALKPGLYFAKGKGQGHNLDWPADGDAFLILARAVGISTNAAARMMKWDQHQRASFRWASLRDSLQVPDLIQKYGLKVKWDEQRGMVWADWREYAGRFPGVARAMRKLAAGERLRLAEAHVVRSVLAAALKWYEVPGPQMISPRWTVETRMRKLWEMVRRLQAAGVEILEERDEYEKAHIRFHCAVQEYERWVRAVRAGDPGGAGDFFDERGAPSPGETGTGGEDRAHAGRGDLAGDQGGRGRVAIGQGVRKIRVKEFELIDLLLRKITLKEAALRMGITKAALMGRARWLYQRLGIRRRKELWMWWESLPAGGGLELDGKWLIPSRN